MNSSGTFTNLDGNVSILFTSKCKELDAGLNADDDLGNASQSMTVEQLKKNSVLELNNQNYHVIYRIVVKPHQSR